MPIVLTVSGEETTTKTTDQHNPTGGVKGTLVYHGISFHTARTGFGSWNKASPGGFQVSRITCHGGETSMDYEEFFIKMLDNYFGT